MSVVLINLSPGRMRLVMLLVASRDPAGSAAADRDDDLEPVAIGDRVRCELTARHDLTIALDGDALACQAERVDEALEGKRVIELAAFAIDGHCHHGQNVSCAETPSNQLRPGAGSKYWPLPAATITDPMYCRSVTLSTRMNSVNRHWRVRCSNPSRRFATV